MMGSTKSGATVGGCARVSLMSCDEKENMAAELRKAAQGEKQGKREGVQTDVHGNEEKEQLSRRALRKGRVLSYKEPSIMSKIRRCLPACIPRFCAPMRCPQLIRTYYSNGNPITLSSRYHQI